MGNDGPQGFDGPPGNDGTNGVGFTFRGAWFPTFNYDVMDVVSRDGSSFVALSTTRGVDPLVDVAGGGSTWEMVASKGDVGLAGNDGVPGTPGANGVSGLEVVTNSEFLNNPGAVTLTAQCPIGKAAISGGCGVEPPEGYYSNYSIHSCLPVSVPDAQGDTPLLPNAWRVSAFLVSDRNVPLTVKAICAAIP
jgi:hypothetical protein